jgi:hypothetical protein
VSNRRDIDAAYAAGVSCQFFYDYFRSRCNLVVYASRTLQLKGVDVALHSFGGKVTLLEEKHVKNRWENILFERMSYPALDVKGWGYTSKMHELLWTFPSGDDREAWLFDWLILKPWILANEASFKSTQQKYTNNHSECLKIPLKRILAECPEAIIRHWLQQKGS